MENHLNSVLLEGYVIEIHEKDFIIQSFRDVPNEIGNAVMIENKFQIMTVYGRKYPISKGTKIRVVGRLQFQDGDKVVTIVPEHIEFAK